MKHRLAILAGTVVLAAACSAGTVSDGAGTAPPNASPASIPIPAPPALRSETRPIGSTPEPLVERVFKPAPEAAVPPAPKTPRRSSPTPPPSRDRAAVERPVWIRTPPGAETSPSISHDDPRVRAAIADLAVLLEVEATAVDLLDARSVTWRDGSVGCPQSGLVYSQAIVPGSLVVLRVGDSSFRYHASGDLMPRYCPTPEPPLEGGA